MTLGSRRKMVESGVPEDPEVATEVTEGQSGWPPPAPEPAVPPVAVSDGPVLSVRLAAAELDALRTVVTDLQAIVAALEPHSGKRKDGASTDEAAAGTRIIVAAKEEANATIEAARTAARVLADESEATSAKIIAAARDLAGREFAAEQSRVARSREAWSAHRASIAATLTTAGSSLDAFRGDLAVAAEAISAAIADLEMVTWTAESAENEVESVAEKVAEPVSESVPEVVPEDVAEPLVEDRPELVPERVADLVAKTAPADSEVDLTSGTKHEGLFATPGGGDRAGQMASAAFEAEPPAEVTPASETLRPGLFGR